MQATPRPTVIIACRVMQELLGKMLPGDIPVTYLEITLHNTPKKLAAALQSEIDAVPNPSTIIVGYGNYLGGKTGTH